jgi:hypothetical protein
MSRFCFRRSGLRLHHRLGREIAVSAWRAQWRPASEKLRYFRAILNPLGL